MWVISLTSRLPRLEPSESLSEHHIGDLAIAMLSGNPWNVWVTMDGFSGSWTCNGLLHVAQGIALFGIAPFATPPVAMDHDDLQRKVSSLVESLSAPSSIADSYQNTVKLTSGSKSSIQLREPTQVSGRAQLRSRSPRGGRESHSDRRSSGASSIVLLWSRSCRKQDDKEKDRRRREEREKEKEREREKEKEKETASTTNCQL